MKDRVGPDAEDSAFTKEVMRSGSLGNDRPATNDILRDDVRPTIPFIPLKPSRFRKGGSISLCHAQLLGNLSYRESVETAGALGTIGAVTLALAVEATDARSNSDARMEEKGMRKVILVSALLVVLALLIAPALAAPTPYLHKVTWRGSGIDSESGAHVKFSGSSIQTQPDEYSWVGSGTFIDPSRGLKATTYTWHAIDCDLANGIIYWNGYADVTIGSESYQGVEIGLRLDKSAALYDLWIQNPGGTEMLGSYRVAGDDFKGIIKMI